MSDDPTAGGGVLLRLGAVLVLLLLNAFFVAAEFALVSVRRARIEQLARAGDRPALRVQRALARLDRHVSAAQLGVTAATLALGWVGQPVIARFVDGAMARFGVRAPAGAHSAAALTVAFLALVVLHVVLGVLAPKNVAIVRAEGASRALAGPIALFARLAGPLVWALNGAAGALLRLFGTRPARDGEHAHGPDDLRLLVQQAREHGQLDAADTAMLSGVFDFHDKKAVDVMRPRTEVVALDIDTDEAELRATLAVQGYSRYPVYRDTLDEIVGVFLAKDLWVRAPSAGPFALSSYVRDAVFVPASRRAERVMEDLRRTRAHMAVVLDEYGGTAGIITMEDLVEEVIGEIADEHDPAMRAALELDGVLELAGTMSLIDVRGDHHLDIPDGDWTTLGGYVFARVGRVPRIGDRAPFPGGELEVVAMDARRVAALRVHREQSATVRR